MRERLDTVPKHTDKKSAGHASGTYRYETRYQRPRIGVREKLIVLFLFIKIIPLVILACITWYALVILGQSSRDVAVEDARTALTASAVENIERLTAETAQSIASFLYLRDADIRTLAQLSKHFLTEYPDTSLQSLESVFADFSENKFGLIRRHGDWKIAGDGMSWQPVNPCIPMAESADCSVNPENNAVVYGATFRHRPPYGFGNAAGNFDAVPYYDEIAFLDKTGRQMVKYVNSRSTKTRFPFPSELLDVSDSGNTFVKAERYFEELYHLGDGDIYVSDVIGAYVPSRFIGMHTPDYMASTYIDARISELESEDHRYHAETIWQLRVLNAELRNDEARFNSRLESNCPIRDEIDRRLGRNQIWRIEKKTLDQVADELRFLGLADLADTILNIPFHPEGDAYAGIENPVGVRFEGIIRWAMPVYDDGGELLGYVTFALNHDHLLSMVQHITPMPQRFSESPDASGGNYTFMWDYLCRNIAHPRHHSIVGYDSETGIAEIPWLEQTLYDGMIAAGFDIADWQDYLATLENYTPWSGDDNSQGFQSRSKQAAAELTALGLVGLDGRYSNYAPQCTGWMNLTEDGGSGSLYMQWDGLHKLTSAAAIPYFTGKYCPNVQGNRRGFGFVTIGAGIDDFNHPAQRLGDTLSIMANDNVQILTFYLVWTTVILSLIVIGIAVWMASFLSKKLHWIIDGVMRFQRGNRTFRFLIDQQDEFSVLANAFNDMADNIVYSVHTPVVITDLDLNIIYANEPCLSLINALSLDEIIGKYYPDISVYGFGSEHCPITALLTGKKRGDVIHLKEVGLYLYGIARYFYDEHGQRIGYITRSYDVTEQSLKQIELEKKQAELEFANQHKRRFLARMSHELRTPMNAMIGFNDLMQAQLGYIADLEEQWELSNYLTQLRRASLQLLDLLNDILEVADLESGEAMLLNKPFDLSIMLKELDNYVAAECAEKKIKFITSIDDEMPTDLYADGMRLQSVLLHLLENAVMCTPEGGQVELTARQIERQGHAVKFLFSVRDTGPGIPSDHIKTILEPSGEDAYPSFGNTVGHSVFDHNINLMIAHKNMEMFGSQLEIYSELGLGSEFAFEIWLSEQQPEDKRAPDVSGTLPRMSFPAIDRCFDGQKILVVDDVRVNRIVLVNLLREFGFTVDEAKDGKEAFEKFMESPEHGYRIVFMDIQMPIIDGWESTILIRNLPRQDAKTTPIVAISANAFQEDIDKSLASGLNAHYAKPVQREMLAEILSRYANTTNTNT